MDDFERLIGVLTLAPEPDARPMARAASHDLPGKGVPILAAAISAGVLALVTGDRRDFGRLYGQVIEGVEVITPGEALSRALTRNG